jgi:tRNA(Ile)-lysidine synthase
MLSAAQLAPEKSFRFIVAHINHKLRGRDADADAAFVVRIAERVGLPMVLRNGRVARRIAGNLEERARERRYKELARIAKQRRSALVLTAHTLDDQAETVFMNLLRGTGGDGLAGMPALRPLSGKIRLGRPFLSLGRAELHGWLDRCHVRARTDRSNRDESFLRNWLRRNLFPQLAHRSPGFKVRLANLATLLHDEKTFWSDYLDDVEKRVLRADRGGRLLDLGGLLRYSAAVQRRFLRRVVGENLMTFGAVERLRFWMMSPPTGGRLFQLRRGWTVTRLSKSKGALSVKLFLIKEENHK